MDNVEKSFSVLCEETDYLNPREAGHLFLVYGKAGCGKTSLINRSAEHLRQHYEARNLQATIVDLARDASQGGSPIERRLHVQAQLISEQLYSTGVLREPEYEPFRERTEDEVIFANFLEAFLQRSPERILILLLPSVELRAELDAYQNVWRRRRTLALCETSVEEVFAHSRRVYGPSAARPITILEVGPLRPEDGWAFVSDRLRLAQFRNGGRMELTIDEEVLRGYMEARMLHNSEVSIRELLRTCRAVFDRVIKSGRTDVSLNDFAMHWMSVGRY